MEQHVVPGVVESTLCLALSRRVEAVKTFLECGWAVCINHAGCMNMAVFPDHSANKMIRNKDSGKSQHLDDIILWTSWAGTVLATLSAQGGRTVISSYG